MFAGRYSYVLVVLVDGQEQVIRHYHRRPSRAFLDSLPQRHVRGRSETHGTLRLERVKTT